MASRQHGRDPRSGYALLLVFAMASIIAVGLYVSAPRIAFEAQRDQEQLLVDRGEQYVRGIRLYYRKTNRYPARIEDLENSGGLRFLRRRYADPMTGKDDWRLIHVGPGNILTDSINNKKKTPNGASGSVNTFITELQPAGEAPANGAANLALRRRPSEMPGFENGAVEMPPNVTDPANVPLATAAPPTYVGPAPLGADGRPLTPPNGQAPAAGAPAGVTPNTGYPNPTGAYAGGYPNPTGFYAGQTGNAAPGNGVPPVPGMPPGGPGPSRFGGGVVGGIPGQPGMATGGAGSGNAGADVIQRLLTSPRPGGFPGDPNTAGGFAAGGGLQSAPGAPGGGGLGTPITGTAGGGQIVGGGIAGLASKAERSGIKIYNDHTKYNEWEFIYDFGKEAAQGMNGARPGPNQNPNSPNPPAPNNPAGNVGMKAQ